MRLRCVFVIDQTRGVEAAAVPGFVLDLVAHAPRVPDVAHDDVKLPRLDARDGMQLRGPATVDRKLQAVQPCQHAFAHARGRGEAAVGGEEHVGIAAFTLGVAYGFAQPVAEERLAEVEHAELLDAQLAQLPHAPGVDLPRHVGFLARARVRGAEEALEIAAPGELDLDALRHRRGRTAGFGGEGGQAVDAGSDAVHVRVLAACRLKCSQDRRSAPAPHLDRPVFLTWIKAAPLLDIDQAAPAGRPIPSRQYLTPGKTRCRLGNRSITTSSGSSP